MANGLSTFINMLGQKPQPGFAAGMMKGQDEALTRRKLEEEMERAEALAPYELLKAQREAEQGPKKPAIQEKAEYLQSALGVDTETSIGIATGRYKHHTDPATGNVYLVDSWTGRPVDPNTTRLVVQGYEAIGEAPPSADTGTSAGGGQPEIGIDTEGATTAPPSDTTAQPGVPPPLFTGTKEEERRAAQEQKEYERTRDFKQDVTAYGDRYAKANIGIMEGELSNAEKLLQEHATTEVVPGRGPIERFAPSFLKSKEGREFTQTMQSNFNRMLKERSGAAVTEQEFQRLAKEAGVDNFDTQDQVITGIKLWRQALENTRAQIYGTADPEVASEYEKRSDLRARPFSPELARDKALDKEQGKYTYAPEAELPDGTRIYRLGPNQPWRYADGTIFVRPPSSQSETNADQQSGTQQQATRGQRGGAVATNQATGATQDTPTPEQDPVASADPTQETISSLRGELDSGVSKKDVKKRVDAMKADGTISQREYVQIMRELQLGTYDVQAQRSSRGRGQRGGGTR